VVELLKLAEVARRLGISEPTARRYVKSGKLPSVYVGGSYRVRETDIEEFLRQAQVRPGENLPKAGAPSSTEPSLTDVLEEERRLEDEATLAVLFRSLARRARLIVERSRREGTSAELGEDAAALHADAKALYGLRRLRARRDIFGTGSDELADAVDAYEEVEGTIQAMLRQDVEATDEERDTARRFRPGTDEASKHGEADAS
jgi:excisionase family DNA binding protein